MELKIVKITGPHRAGYSIILDEDGYMSEIATYSKKSVADSMRGVLLATKYEQDFALVAISRLVEIHTLAHRIATTTEEVGGAGYATKKHMKRWASDIFYLAADALSSSSLPVEDKL